MSGKSVPLTIKLNFPVVLITVFLLHLLFLGWKGLAPFEKYVETPQESARAIKIRDIRTVGSKESKVKDSAYLNKAKIAAETISKNKSGAVAPAKSLSLKDLMALKSTTPPVRPGTRPEVTQEKTKPLAAISLKGSEMRKFVQGPSANALSGDPRAASLSNSDVMVNLEVPEGVNPDELNKYELMFYGFQRRTAINYVNSFYKRLDKFNRENPHMTFPMTDTKQVMTGRLTYDEKGNIKQIKMIRWSNVGRLQDFFLDVLKDMDTLHNPPQALWEKDGEFSIFFSLVVNG